ncbi:hypothetical protein ABZ815_20465 [Nonomuraea sp. NPDC047529]|uniref:hypothetical protein n=1 Tax=Nonomuraea sp. NPDC047529 TaxID=3155623 RepID=UPI0033D34E10
MSRILGQLTFALIAFVFAVTLAGAILWRDHTPQSTAAKDREARGREPRVLASLVLIVFAAELAAVWATWPDE